MRCALFLSIAIGVAISFRLPATRQTASQLKQVDADEVASMTIRIVTTPEQYFQHFHCVSVDSLECVRFAWTVPSLYKI
jgi:hypothetical protein